MRAKQAKSISGFNHTIGLILKNPKNALFMA
jgi:hypothetical protein